MRDAVHIPPALHELEAEVMEELRQRHQASVREVMEALNTGAPKERAYTTYMTIMVRLDTKGLLERTREGKTDFFRPVYTRDRYTDLRAEAEVDSLVDQFGEGRSGTSPGRWLKWTPNAVGPYSALLAKTDTSQERPDHRHVFGLALTLGAGGLLAVVAVVATAIDSVHHAVGGYRHVAIAGVPFTYPTLNAAEVLLLALATLGAAVVAIAVKASWRQRQAYRCFIGRMGIVGSLDKHPSVRVIEDPRPQAFCAGYLRPAVYISRRTLDLLADDELEAVLAHERYHLRVRDPLRFACGRVLGEALFFVPVLRSLCDRYGDLAELRGR